MLDEIKIFFRERLIKILDKYLSGKSLFTKSNTLIIVRFDAIGDYILFRNFLNTIKKSEKFKNYKITLCGNIIWKDLAETFDKDIVDKFIWIDKMKFKKKEEWIYRFTKMFEIHNSGFEILIQPNDTLSRASNYIVKNSGIKTKILEESDSIFFLKDIESNSINSGNGYSEVFKKSIFQFYRNKNFIEQITESKIDFPKPFFYEYKTDKKENYLVIFPGAGYESRKWAAINFAALCKKISKDKDLNIVICGSYADRISAKIIIKETGLNNISDMTGKTNLPELINIISKAKLVISNETCAVHIAAAVDTQAVCISNGNHFGRFNPYPEELTSLILTIYPEEISKEYSEFYKLVKKYHYKSDLDINKITPDKVFEEVVKLFKYERINN